jgi:hypothetical protein
MAAVRAIVVCAIVYIFACVKDYWRYCLLLIGLLWLYSGISAYQKDNASRETNDIESIADTIESMETIDNIYYYVGNSENVSLNVFNIQLRNPSSVIHIIKSWDEIELLDQGCYIITNKLEELKTTYFSDVKILERNKSFALLQKQ